MAEPADDDQMRCCHCGERIPDGADHRIDPAVEDGRAVHRHFCGEDCLREWSC